VSFRSQVIARAMASTPLAVGALLVTSVFAGMGIVWPGVQGFKAVYFLVPFVVLLVEALNEKPHWMPDLGYRGGKWIRCCQPLCPWWES
jgi:hypothetical protein